MTASRRNFLQIAGSAAAAITLGRRAEAEPLSRLAPLAPEDPGVKALEDKLIRARPVPVANVRLTGGPLKLAQDADAKYLLSLEPDRMMAFYRIRAGLPKKAEPYDGWDGEGRNLTGHIAGHHLSAVSLMYLATGEAQFKTRADVLVREMKEVQDKNGDGYLGAILSGPGPGGAPPKDGRQMFADVSKGDIRSGAFDLNGIWSPWYTLHKTFAGLRDAYRHTGNKTALDLEIKFAKWAEGVLAPMSDAQVARMLNTEHGGMNEVLADLYADTGDKRWLSLSYRFEHHAFTDALKRGQDNLNGKHGNCQIPKLIGSAARYGYTADPGDVMAASFFFDRVAEHHSYATGGHGLAEYFGPADKLSPRVDGRAAETCNVYNMIKLARRLFAIRPDAFYADFHERALFNHILASFDPEEGRSSYMVPVGRGVQQEYQDMQHSFTCCVGTGMESHALHGYGIYYESNDTLWVNLFAPSTAQFTTAGVNLKMETGFPDGDDATLTLALPSPKEFTLAIRRPGWAGDGFAVKVNGAAVPQPTLESMRAGGAGGSFIAADQPAMPPSSFVALKRTWKSGDVVELTLPKTVRLEPTPDNKTVAAVMWGPLVLAGDHGPRVEGRASSATAPVPALVADKPVTDWVVPAARMGDFRANGVARVLGGSTSPGDVSLTPFYRTHRRRYSVYFDVLTSAEYEARNTAIAAEKERVRKMEAATLGFVQPSDMQAERTYNFQAEPSGPPQRANGRSSRSGTGWFSYDLPVDPAADVALVVTHFNEPGLQPAAGTFQILIDGTEIARFTPNATAVGFFDVQYAIPSALVRGKSKATIRFQAVAPGRIAPVFGVRTIRAGG